MTAPWPHGDPRDVARSVVADPRFALTPPPPPQRTVIDVAWEWLVSVLRGVFGSIGHALGAHNPLGVAAGGVAIAVIFGLLAFGVYLAVRSITVGPAARAGATGSGLDGPDVPVSAAALLAAARAAAVARRFREAAGLLFASAARALDERGRLPYDPARTPGEYRRLVRDPRFDELARDAVTALFAAAEPHAELFERMSGAYDRFFDDARAR